MTNFTKEEREEIALWADLIEDGRDPAGELSYEAFLRWQTTAAAALRAYAEAMSAVPVAWQESLYGQPWRHVETWYAQAAQAKMAAGEDMGNIRFRPLYAAHPVSAPAEPVAVKALEWRGDWPRDIGWADTIVGRYMIFGGLWKREADAIWKPGGKDGAQADYEARIRSALVSPPAPVAEAGAGSAVPDLEEAIRLAEIGEYLYSAKAYSYGDGHTEPREYGIEWQWQQSAPNTFGQGILLAEATAWHEQMAADGIVTEASKLRAVLAAAPPPPAREIGEANDG